ncbi:MAG: ribonuclease P protein component [Candidatus Brocadiales bacterium]
MNGATHINKDARLKKTERLGKRKDFERVFERKVSFRGTNLVAYVLTNSLDFSRLGIVTGKKVGGAVKRNRMRRLIRECFRLNKSLLGTGLDVVIIPGKNFPTTFKGAEEEFKRFVRWCNARRAR